MALSCTPPDDAYLIAAFPGVVLRTPEKWLVTVLAAQQGAYDIEMGGASFPYDALLTDTVTLIRSGLLFQLGFQILAAVTPTGVNAIQLQEVGTAGLGITVSGPAPDTIQANLISGGDGNAAFRQFWLDRSVCGMPPCCLFTCEGDYQLMWAALAAHWIFTLSPQNLGGTGSGANDFDSMRLGPAALNRGKSAWSANPADDDLSKTAPGQLYLQLRARYLIPAFCV